MIDRFEEATKVGSRLLWHRERNGGFFTNSAESRRTTGDPDRNGPRLAVKAGQPASNFNSIEGLRRSFCLMSKANPPTSDPSILNFYALEGRPVVIDGLSHEGWVWQGGSWTSDLGLAQKSFTKGLPLSQDDFLHRFPDAALALLDDQKT
ncbi:MAG: hypothetical protein JKY36_04755 [Erythrobacter sp.]|nr:hypothetical protein [Erythrobacter sp.]